MSDESTLRYPEWALRNIGAMIKSLSKDEYEFDRDTPSLVANLEDEIAMAKVKAELCGEPYDRIGGFELEWSMLKPKIMDKGRDYKRRLRELRDAGVRI